MILCIQKNTQVISRLNRIHSIKILFALKKIILFFYIWVVVDKLHAQNKGIIPGEQMVYDAHYGLIHAATVVVKTDTEFVNFHDRVCYNTSVAARTKGVVGFFTNIENLYTSYIDTLTLQAHKFIRHVRENNYELYEITEFDTTSKMVIVSKRKDQNVYELQSYPLKAAQDVVSSFYFLRRLVASNTLKQADTLDIRFFLEDTTYTVTLKVLDTKKRKTHYGKRKVYILGLESPEMQKGFLNERNPIRVWVTQDQYFIPVFAEVRTKYGDLELELIEYSLFHKRKRFAWLFPKQKELLEE